jgi:hypothetical protein
MQEAENRRIMIPRPTLSKNISETPSQQKKLGVVACTCYPSNGRKLK